MRLVQVHSYTPYPQGEMRNAYRIFTENPGKKETLSRLIHIYLKETGLKVWTDFIRLRI
jgi:predicted N-formylglutamate amidohydrolase